MLQKPDRKKNVKNHPIEHSFFVDLPNWKIENNRSKNTEFRLRMIEPNRVAKSWLGGKQICANTRFSSRSRGISGFPPLLSGTYRNLGARIPNPDFGTGTESSDEKMRHMC